MPGICDKCSNSTILFSFLNKSRVRILYYLISSLKVPDDSATFIYVNKKTKQRETSCTDRDFTIIPRPPKPSSYFP